MTVKRMYAAPLEGVTGYVWRGAHRTVFGGADRYYTPFIAPDRNYHFQTKQLRELSQGESDLVPQLLVNRADYFIWTARELEKMGYKEVDLNLGCPSGTVVAKHKGSGMLRDTEALDAILGEIFAALPDMKISVKTRIGLRSEDEWEAVSEVFARYPISELIIHPRLQCEFYNGAARREMFLRELGKSPLPLVYNGDVGSPDDPAFGWDCPVMAGRGLIKDPALFRRARGGESANREELIRFHGLLTEGYRTYMQGDVPLLHCMKELWSYLRYSFSDTEDAMKRMHKAKDIAEYSAAADAVLKGCPLASEE